ncbi:hypothetical protein ACRDNQ_01085 [Palleronia sp. KMU-117]|uniref:hypothetical protein n=1 Tax=Palleronia sp. KMU-117 TaxID=3434108 RepID=UPI003D735459
MRRPIAAAATTLVLTGLGGTAMAGTIERACLSSDRPGISRSLCGCIQQAADLTLSTKDQRLAASFFKDPHRAQEVRQSDRRSDEEFWERYVNFGTAAETYCRN